MCSMENRFPPEREVGGRRSQYYNYWHDPQHTHIIIVVGIYLIACVSVKGTCPYEGNMALSAPEEWTHPYVIRDSNTRPLGVKVGTNPLKGPNVHDFFLRVPVTYYCMRVIWSCLIIKAYV